MLWSNYPDTSIFCVIFRWFGIQLNPQFMAIDLKYVRPSLNFCGCLCSCSIKKKYYYVILLLRSYDNIFFYNAWIIILKLKLEGYVFYAVQGLLFKHYCFRRWNISYYLIIIRMVEIILLSISTGHNNLDSWIY